MRAVLLAILLAHLPSFAGAEQAASMVGRTYSRPAPGALVLLLPPGADAVELEPGIPILLKALHTELSTAGYRTALLDKPTYQTVWAQEVEAVGGIFDSLTGRPKQPQQAAALSALAARLARETSAALVVLPKLVTRQATLHGTKAAWDGRLEFLPTRGAFGGAAESRGSTMAISVQLLALSGNGNVAFNSFGGIALPYVVNFVTERHELRKDIFDVPVDVVKGTRIALEPLLTK